jgi:DNA-binding Lrp family transcriptional regulator
MSSARKSKAARSKLPKTFRAFVLIQTVPGRVEGVLRTLRRLEPVQSVDSVTGPYDLVAIVEVDELKDLSHVVAGTIGGLRGVTRTTTLLCTE